MENEEFKIVPSSWFLVLGKKNSYLKQRTKNQPSLKLRQAGKEQRTKSGFTLIELSIVLVIIGLVVSGIVGGQSLIHASELQSIISGVRQYEVAILNFNLQYDALPGDMGNAKQYWPVKCYNAFMNTCNGNDDGLIMPLGGSPSIWYEVIRAPQHLALSGFIPGDYSGTWEPGGLYNMTAGVNIQESKIEGVAYWLATWSGTTSYTGVIDRQGLAIFVGSDSGVIYHGGSFTPMDAKAMDKKVDDGVAWGGEVRGANRSFSTAGGRCTRPSTRKYRLRDDTKQCIMAFFIGD